MLLGDDAFRRLCRARAELSSGARAPVATIAKRAGIAPHHFIRVFDAVFGEIDLPAEGEWKAATRDRAVSARAVLLRHSWAVGLMDSPRQPGPATLRHHNAVLGVLRRGGFSVAMAAHAVSLIDSYVYGFVLQELSLPFTNRAELDEVAGAMQRDLPDDHPYLAEAVEHALRPDYDPAGEFEFGLSLILDGLRPDESHLNAAVAPSTSQGD